MQTVAVLVLDGVIAIDAAMPVDAFRGIELADGRPAYDVRVCAPTPEVASAHLTLRVPHGLEALDVADTVFIPGRDDFTAPNDPAVLSGLRAAAERGARIASICVGAFTLAETGLLDGLRATTHWVAADELARRYPAVTVDPNVLFVDNGSILTSAGVAAGLDLCLHMIRRDHGSAVAADAARYAVMPLEREGGQAQFIRHPLPSPAGASLEPTLRWMDEHLAEALPVERLAARAGLNGRTFSRRFREQTGTTPLRWLQHKRIRRAQVLLETTDHAVERIGSTVGFGSPAGFRDQFRRHVGTSPQSYRRAFRSEAI
jgi:transcriptional regulator GlxA family with amidase domain